MWVDVIEGFADLALICAILRFSSPRAFDRPPIRTHQPPIEIWTEIAHRTKLRLLLTLASALAGEAVPDQAVPTERRGVIALHYDLLRRLLHCASDRARHPVLVVVVD